MKLLCAIVALCVHGLSSCGDALALTFRAESFGARVRSAGVVFAGTVSEMNPVGRGHIVQVLLRSVITSGGRPIARFDGDDLVHASKDPTDEDYGLRMSEEKFLDQIRTLARSNGENEKR